MSARRLPGRILALSPGDLRTETADAWSRRAFDAIDAGLDAVVLREPELSDRATLALARALREALGPGWLAVHDRVHLASACGADAVHLGFRSLAIEAARAVVGDELAIGLSAHAADDASAWSGADYLVFGPVFATPSKQGLLEPVGIEGLRRAARSTSIPVWGLGGVDAARVDAVLASGCRGVAVRGALLGAPDPAAAWRRFAATANG